MRRRRTARATTVVLLVAVAALTACSSTDDGAGISAGGSTTPPTDETSPGSTGSETSPGSTRSTGTTPAPAGDAGGATRDAYVAALVEAMAAEDTMFAGPDEGRCLAEAIVDGVGVDAIEQAGLTPEQFGGDAGGEALAGLVDEQGASAIAAAMVGCYEDPVAVFAEAFAEGASPEVVACLRAELDEDELRRFFEIILFVDADDDPEVADEVMQLYLDLGGACPGIM